MHGNFLNKKIIQLKESSTKILIASLNILSGKNTVRNIDWFIWPLCRRSLCLGLGLWPTGCVPCLNAHCPIYQCFPISPDTHVACDQKSTADQTGLQIDQLRNNLENWSPKWGQNCHPLPFKCLVNFAWKSRNALWENCTTFLTVFKNTSIYGTQWNQELACESMKKRVKVFFSIYIPNILIRVNIVAAFFIISKWWANEIFSFQ